MKVYLAEDSELHRSVALKVYLDAFTSFGAALTWPEAQQRIQALLDRGLQREVDFETRWTAVLGTLFET